MRWTANKVITALGSIDFPVPRTYCLYEDESVVGTMFILWIWLRRILWDPLLPICPKRAVARFLKRRSDAGLFAMQIKTIELGDFDEYFGRQISR